MLGGEEGILLNHTVCWWHKQIELKTTLTSLLFTWLWFFLLFSYFSSSMYIYVCIYICICVYVYIITTHRVWIRIVIPTVVCCFCCYFPSLRANRGMDRLAFLLLICFFFQEMVIKLTGAGEQRTFTGILGETVVGDLSFWCSSLISSFT